MPAAGLSPNNYRSKDQYRYPQSVGKRHKVEPFANDHEVLRKQQAVRNDGDGRRCVVAEMRYEDEIQSYICRGANRTGPQGQF